MFVFVHHVTGNIYKVVFFFSLFSLFFILLVLLFILFLKKMIINEYRVINNCTQDEYQVGKVYFKAQ
jgi:hypothetical protein